MPAWSSTVRRGAAVASLAALLVPLSACGGESAPAPREGMRVAELLDDPSGDVDLEQLRVGAQLSLRATVAQVLSPDSFVVTPQDAGGSAPLLVLSDLGEVRPGQVLQLTGIVRVFIHDAYADELVLADPAAYAAFDRQKTLVAEVVDDNLPLDDQ